MARPLSDEKRSAILNAATEVVATLGVGAPTAKIAKVAGVAEGTLFTYFATKDELLNQLYLELKMSLRDDMLAGYPAGKKLIDRGRHVWDGYVKWGANHPLKRKAMNQLAVSGRITEENRRIGVQAFSQADELLREAFAHGPLKDLPPSFGAALLGAMAETTMDFIARDPDRAEQYTRSGFEAFWRATTR